MKAFIKVLQDISLLIARLVVGATLIIHGWTRWQVDGTTHSSAILEAAGLPEPYTLALLTIAFELIGGVLLIFGLGTPIIGLALAVMQGLIVFLLKWDNGFFLADGGWEYNAIFGALGLVLATIGSGRLGVDALFVRPPATDDEDVAQPFIDDRPVHRKPTAHA